MLYPIRLDAFSVETLRAMRQEIFLASCGERDDKRRACYRKQLQTIERAMVERSQLENVK